MKIYVNRVPAEGLAIATTYAPKVFDTGRDDARPTVPIHMAARITTTEDELFVQASLRCVLACTCARCLVGFEHVITKDCAFHYDVRARVVVDVTDDIRQEILLEYPMIPVCQAACRGLCAHCGHNLNESECTHHVTRSEGARGES